MHVTLASSLTWQREGAGAYETSLRAGRHIKWMIAIPVPNRDRHGDFSLKDGYSSHACIFRNQCRSICYCCILTAHYHFICPLLFKLKSCCFLKDSCLNKEIIINKRVHNYSCFEGKVLWAFLLSYLIFGTVYRKLHFKKNIYVFLPGGTIVRHEERSVKKTK